MPRIDPQQLLKTLGVLLAPHGGIKSSEEVVRLVQLMQKFSRKLVSKCIYIRILKRTPNHLIEQFLCEKGWELLNQWFSDAIKTQNWPLCREMIELFNICPISAARLKENVDDNHAPKLINQLRQEISIDPDIKALATEVYTKWVRIVSPAISREKRKGLGALRGSGKVSDAIVGESDDNSSCSTDDSATTQSDASSSSPSKSFNRAKDSIVKDGSKSDGPISLLQSLADEVSESIKKEKKGSINKLERKDDTRGSSKHENPKDSRKSDERHKDKSKSHHHSSHRSSHHSSSHDKDKKRDSGSSKREVSSKHSSSRDREHRRYRHTDPRDEVDAQEKQRIKEKARKLKEEAQAKKDKETLNKVSGSSSSASSLSKIPKIPKKAVKEEDKKTGQSFTDLMGHLDSKPTTVKKPVHKNKTAAILESMKSAATQKSNKDSSVKSSSLKKEINAKEKDLSNRRDSVSLISSSIDNKKESSPVSGNKKPVNGDNGRPSLSISDANKNKKPEKESPKLGSKQSPSIISSSGFMDAIFHTMKKDEPRKRKRRLSDREEFKESSNAEKKNGEKDLSPDKKIKGEENLKEEKKEGKSASIPAFSFYRELDTLDTNKEEPKVKDEGNKKISPKSSATEMNDEAMKNGSDEEPDNDSKNAEEKDGSDDNLMPLEEPLDTNPREVKGILVYHRGKDKRNKTIKWKAESALVNIRYFEMDEDERVNVNKVKFENMRDMETKMEKAAFSAKGDLNDEEQDIANWYKPVPLTFDESGDQKPCFIAYGKESKEKDIQAERERTVLQALYFNREMTPSTPGEPDNPADSIRSSLINAVPIPLDDKEADENSYHDYTHEGWPDTKVNKVDQHASISSAFSLPPALSSLLATIETSGFESIIPSPGSLSQEDQSTLAAQTAAIQKLGMIPGVDLAPNFPPPIKTIPTTNTGNGIAMDNPPQIGGPPNIPLHQRPPMGMDPFAVPGLPRFLPPQMHNIPPNVAQQPPFGMGSEPIPDNAYNNFTQHPMQPFHGNGSFQGGMNNRGKPHFGMGSNPNGFRGGRHGMEKFNRDRENFKDRSRGGRRNDEQNHSNFRSRPCKFFMETGTCREGERCTFLHQN